MNHDQELADLLCECTVESDAILGSFPRHNIMVLD